MPSKETAAKSSAISTFAIKSPAISTIFHRLHFVTLCHTKIFLFFFLFSARGADWPALHGNPEHTGRSEEQLQFPLTLQWAVEFENERIGTAVEPIVVSKRVAIPTHAGSLYILDALSGSVIERQQFDVPLLHSPGVENDRFLPLREGQSASIVPTSVGFCLGYRNGAVFTTNGEDGDRVKFNAPLRQTPAASGDQIFVTTEDLRLHCIDARSARLIWTSEQMFGQTARDYYPVIVHAAGKKFVVVRTNPVLNMAKQIADDRNFLTKQAGIDASDWKKLDAWIKSPAAVGTPELIAREQDAIVHYLETNQCAQTFYVFDAATGKRAFTPPIMWVGGCQGVGTPPAITKEGKAVVLYRSAYGNWNHGVAPLVAIGLLNFETGRIEPLRHNQGAQPPWDTFWGTADEAENFTIAGDDLIIVHQGTLARFNLKTHDLEKIWGERDTYGGFKNPSWARNEWHGPARGGVAISNGHIYWITGSRLLCLGSEKPSSPVTPQTIRAKSEAQQNRGLDFQSTVRIFDTKAALDAVLEERWAPLYVEPGLAGREFFFSDTREIFNALSRAYSPGWLARYFPASFDPKKQTLLIKYLADLYSARPPFETNRLLSLSDGKRREYFQVPPQILSRVSNEKPSHRFGGVYSAYLYAERCNAWTEVIGSWPQIQSAYNDFTNSNPKFGQKPELYFNRYLASLIAFEKISQRANDKKETGLIKPATVTLIHWWKDAGATLTNFNGSRELDPFIGNGDKLSWVVFPHRHKLAIFQDMTPEIGEIIRREAPEAAAQVWSTFTNLAPTWHLTGEERQYHFGENFVDTPDFSLSAFQAFAFVQKAGPAELIHHIDLPCCKADLYQIQKLAIALEANK